METTINGRRILHHKKKGTEARFSGEHCSRYEPGKYGCVCCDNELFDSGEKFDSGTGWPSFTLPIKENAIKYHKDGSFGMIRIEVMCNVCDSHLGMCFKMTTTKWFKILY
jgi:peptide-methionine (R)-S-oxide reductase